MEKRAAPLLMVILLGVIGIIAAGCAAGPTAAPAKTLPEMLADAGFRAYPAATPGQVKHLKICPPETVVKHERAEAAGCYAFADQKTNTMFIGDEAAYQRFRKAMDAQEQKILERKIQDDPEFWINWGHRFGGG